LIDIVNRVRETLGERHAAPADADECQFVDLMIALENLVSDAGERAGDTLCVQDDGH